MDIAVHIGIILVCCVALGKGAAWLVDSAARIARRLGISELVIGLTVVAFGTSAPEFAATISAAMQGDSEVSIGNVVGSNIFNIGFILGGCALVTAIKTKRELIWRDGMLLLVVTAGLFLLLLDGRLDRWEGILMFVVLIGYLVYLARKREMVMDEELPVGAASWRDGVLLVSGLTLIIGGGYFLVESATKIAELAGMSPWLIGVTVVAAVTSVPEFVISLVAILKKHHGISAGNLIGSNIFNTLGVLGLAGAIQLPDKPLLVGQSACVSVGLLIALTLMVVVLMRTGWKLRRWEGAVLIIVGLGIWIFNFWVGKAV